MTLRSSKKEREYSTIQTEEAVETDTVGDSILLCAEARFPGKQRKRPLYSRDGMPLERPTVDPVTTNRSE